MDLFHEFLVVGGKNKMKRKKKFKKPKVLHPPDTNRYCLYCEKMRTFKYNPAINHSECIFCGGRMSRRTAPIIEEFVKVGQANFGSKGK